MDPVLVIVILVLVTSLFYFLTSVFGKEEKSISSALISAGITLILSCVPEYYELVLALIASTQNASIPSSEGQYWVRSIMGLIIIILGIVLDRKLKDRIYILNMFGIAIQKEIDEKGAIDDLRLSEFKVKEQIIDFTPYFDGITMKSKINQDICEHIEQSAKKFSAKVCNQKEACFTGMAPIPYTIYAGTYLENAKINRFFEYSSDNGGYYYEIKKASRKEERNIPKLKLEFPAIISSEATEVVLAISITHKVMHKDLMHFSMDVVDLSIETPRDNVIRYTQQLNTYKETVYNCLETDLINKYPNLQTIHIAASIPSCMSIEIGKSIGLKINRVKEIVVHHYISSSTPPYTFGLFVSGEKKGQLFKFY